MLRGLEKMDALQLDQLLGDWQFEHALAGQTQKGVIELLQDFERRSKAGEFYKPFFMNSKNFDYIPPETEIWYAEMSRWLNYGCKRALDGDNHYAYEVLSLCLHLLDEAGSNDNIVFAHEYGEWMLNIAHDYRAIHQQVSGANPPF